MMSRHIKRLQVMSTVKINLVLQRVGMIAGDIFLTYNRWKNGWSHWYPPSVLKVKNWVKSLIPFNCTFGKNGLSHWYPPSVQKVKNWVKSLISSTCTRSQMKSWVKLLISSTCTRGQVKNWVKSLISSKSTMMGIDKLLTYSMCTKGEKIRAVVHYTWD